MEMYVLSYSLPGSYDLKFVVTTDWEDYLRDNPEHRPYELWVLESPFAPEQITQDMFSEIYLAKVGTTTDSGIKLVKAIGFVQRS